ncbi:hypothetical protein [Pseudomonas migulae]|uniref:Uncharacterized protein n=1 Tax=Pseudomonas migulae TaxID=78543 RepID=A0A1H5LNY7_9PSED|nr:hypothetical protein [Pseudomonas migulae]SEE78724.1 hypothetical protein SAMN04490194_4098 [Pseudomonas migulae]
MPEIIGHNYIGGARSAVGKETRGKSLHLMDSESTARIAALNNAEPVAARRSDSLA